MEMSLRVAKEAKSPGAVSGEIDVKLWRWRDVVTFLLFLAGFTAVGSSLAIISKNLFGASGYYVRILMWSPAFAAMATAAVAGRSLGDFGCHWGRWKWQIQARLVPLLYVAIAYCLIWSLGLGGVPNHEFLAKRKPGLVTSFQRRGDRIADCFCRDNGPAEFFRSAR
jgi:hypothetical protein